MLEGTGTFCYLKMIYHTKICVIWLNDQKTLDTEKDGSYTEL